MVDKKYAKNQFHPNEQSKICIFLQTLLYKKYIAS
jgi:hypothetical protein